MSNMTPDEVLAVLDNEIRALPAMVALIRHGEHQCDETPAIDKLQKARAAVAALIARNAELGAAMEICRKLAALRDGLDNSNSSAEEMASRLAHKAQALVARAEAGHG